MDSIYGGRPGSPFVIKARFNSVKEMQEVFKKGPDYKDVWYGEYCIIDTENKNDFDNGKIYQRGTEYGNETGDAKYVGQVIGPQSGVPGFDFAPFSEVAGYATKAFGDDGEIRTWPSGGKLYQDYKGNTDPAKPNAIDTKSFNVSDGSLVKGWNDNGTFVDSIKYTWVNIAYPYGDTKDNKFAVSKTLMGFQIPYPVFKVKVNAIAPGGTASVTETNTSTGHPFAYEWLFNIPRGAKGDSVSISADSFSQSNTNGVKVNCTTTGVDNNTGQLSSTTNSFIVNEIVDLYSDIGEGKSNHLYALFSGSDARGGDSDSASGYRKGLQSKSLGFDTTRLNWKDLGAIKDQSGVLVGRDLNTDASFSKLNDPTKETIVSTLNTNYTKANGKVDGKVCTYQDKEGNTWFFAWDYNHDSNGWYYIGTFGGGGTKFSVSDGMSDIPKGWYFKKAEKVAFATKKNWWDMP